MTQHHDEDEPRFLVCAGMRNEGPFIVEWVSWYRMLGFEVLVVTNDCTDHSPALLDALQDAGWLTHQPHFPNPKQRPKRSAYNAMRAHPLVGEVDWVLVCDVDEFLVFHEADSVADYVAGFIPPPLGFAFHWRAFGTSGLTQWQDGLVHRTFHAAAETNSRANCFFKSLFRRPTDFEKFGDHSPKDYDGPWAVANHVWVDCNGRRLGRFVPDKWPQKATAADRVRHDKAQMNHYILRTEENFALKRGTPSASAGRDRYTDDFYEKFNRAEIRDESALRFAQRFDAVYAQAMALPQVARLHHLSCADYVVRLAEKAGLRPEEDARWRAHMAAAA
jgi:hypothetical protein